MNRLGERLPDFPNLAPKPGDSQPKPIALSLEFFESCLLADKLAPP
jgi:hypothetical protein